MIVVSSSEVIGMEEIIQKIMKKVSELDGLDSTVYDFEDGKRKRIVISKFKEWFEEPSPDDIEQDVFYYDDKYPDLEVEVTVKNEEIENFLKELGFKPKE